MATMGDRDRSDYAWFGRSAAVRLADLEIRGLLVDQLREDPFTRREAIHVEPGELERRVVVCYTGEPRLSGINNWEMFKSHIDGDADVFDIFEKIRDAAREARAALGAGDWGRVADVMPLRSAFDFL